MSLGPSWTPTALLCEGGRSPSRLCPSADVRPRGLGWALRVNREGSKDGAGSEGCVLTPGSLWSKPHSHTLKPRQPRPECRWWQERVCPPCTRQVPLAGGSRSLRSRSWDCAFPVVSGLRAWPAVPRFRKRPYAVAAWPGPWRTSPGLSPTGWQSQQHRWMEASLFQGSVEIGRW